MAIHHLLNFREIQRRATRDGNDSGSISCNPDSITMGRAAATPIGSNSLEILGFAISVAHNWAPSSTWTVVPTAASGSCTSLGFDLTTFTITPDENLAMTTLPSRTCDISATQIFGDGLSDRTWGYTIACHMDEGEPTFEFPCTMTGKVPDPGLSTNFSTPIATTVCGSVDNAIDITQVYAYTSGTLGYQLYINHTWVDAGKTTWADAIATYDDKGVAPSSVTAGDMLTTAPSA